MKHSVMYVLSIVLVNVMFECVPPVKLFDGTIWSVGSVVAGLVFIARDYAQKELGKKLVVVPMIIACIISYMMASPFVATASTLAFVISELSDWAVFNIKKGSFRSKVITSSLVSVPVDTLVFLFVIDQVSIFSFTVMTISKLIGLLVVVRK